MYQQYHRSSANIHTDPQPLPRALPLQANGCLTNQPRNLFLQTTKKGLSASLGSPNQPTKTIGKELFASRHAKASLSNQRRSRSPIPAIPLPIMLRRRDNSLYPNLKLKTTRSVTSATNGTPRTTTGVLPPPLLPPQRAWAEDRARRALRCVLPGLGSLPRKPDPYQNALGGEKSARPAIVGTPRTRTGTRPLLQAMQVLVLRV